MPVFPSSLPAPLLNSFNETVPDTLIRTKMDQGPDKIRQRTTAGVRPVTVSYIMDSTQLNAFDAFYMTDLSGGALSFDWAHPRTLASVTARFAQPPSYVTMASLFSVSCNIEILP